jgi:hypothetical protein
MSDPVDDVLGRLRGEPLPFQVDWPAYERELWARAARSEAHRRRRTRWSFAAVLAVGLVIGAGLPLILKANVTQPEPLANTTVHVQETPTEEPVVKPLPTVVRQEVVVWESNDRSEQPFTRQFKRADGRLAEIRFEGFTAPDSEAPARLVMAAPGTVQKRAVRR